MVVTAEMKCTVTFGSIENVLKVNGDKFTLTLNILKFTQLYFKMH